MQEEINALESLLRTDEQKRLIYLQLEKQSAEIARLLSGKKASRTYSLLHWCPLRNQRCLAKHF